MPSTICVARLLAILALLALTSAEEPIKSGPTRLGCFKSFGGGGRRLTQESNADWQTASACADTCWRRGFRYAGLRAGRLCRCGQAFGRRNIVRDSDCSLPCPGNRLQTCGGAAHFEVFQTGISRADGIWIGCFKDARDKRDLPQEVRLAQPTTRKLCVAECRTRGYRYAGLQEASSCYCGQSYGMHGSADKGECSLACSGEPGLTCGDRLRNEIFTTGVTKSDGIRMGCYKDAEGTERDMPVKSTQHGYKDLCVAHCRSSGYVYAGLQARLCMCGQSYGRHGRISDSRCSLRCLSKPSQTCGGLLANEIYTTGVSLSEYIGCFEDTTEAIRRPDELPVLAAANSRMTQGQCGRLCKNEGAKYYALKNGRLCRCGNEYPQKLSGRWGNCNVPCEGSSSETCGGRWALEVFKD